MILEQASPSKPHSTMEAIQGVNLGSTEWKKANDVTKWSSESDSEGVSKSFSRDSKVFAKV